MQDIFEEIFRSNQARSFNRRTGPSVTTITISLKDAYTGRIIKHDSKTSINVPAGVRPDTKLYVDGQIFKINIQPDAKFKRAHDDLMTDVTITAVEAMLGINAVLEHLDGNKFQFTIPAGIQSGQIVKLSKTGMKNPETSATGDLLVRVSIQIPRNLTDQEKELVKGLAHRDSINI